MSQGTEPNDTQVPPPPPEDRFDAPRDADPVFDLREPAPRVEERSDVRESVVDTRVSTDKRTWSPAQLVAGAIGLFLVVVGAVALLRGGVETMTSPTSTVLGFVHTPLMAIISVLLGAVFISAAASALGVRGTLKFLGLISLGFGLVVAIEPGATTAWFGGSRALGVLYMVIGVVSLIAGWASPTITSHQRTSTVSGHDRVDTD
ncbi:MAG TPA: hypothetical protein VMM81_04745 [Acidimicrobiia bacterium]|nr:hypothetical protein [Acidimicrobiia bacterium]